MDSRKDRSRVARGATLYSKRDPNKPKTRKIIKSRQNIGDIKITTREIPDKHREDELILKLERAGIEVRSYKKRYLLRRIKARLSKLGHETYGEYLDYLSISAAEINELKESLSINVTRFFRNRDTFETLRDDILPALFAHAKKNGRNEVKIWSAGCAVGAEPYTIAMIAHELVPSKMTVRVIASDVKEELLGIARYATYSDQYVAEMQPFEIQRYFNINEHGEHIVKPEIKRLVSFSKIDLLKDPFPSGIDLILCRNVLIYIDRDAQNEIISNFFSSLKESGMLVLGRTETLFVDWRKHIKIISTKHRIYQKIGLTPQTLPSLDFKEKPKAKNSYLRESISHRDRLNELKNFRKTFEDRKKIWEKRISKTEDADFSKLSKFSKNKVNVTNNFPLLSNKRPATQERETITKSTGQLSNYRANLRKIGLKKQKPEKTSKLLSSKTPEEVYRELKRMREKRRANDLRRNR